jgi:uncharacterized protein DUF2510
MTSPAPPAGWYTDPSDQAGQRWWDGQAWSSHVAPAAAQPAVATIPVQPTPAAASGYGYSMPPQQAYATSTSSAPRNKFALITFAVVALYLLIALETRIVVFGILPLGLSFRSKRAGEPLAVFAIAAAVIAIVVAAARLFG